MQDNHPAFVEYGSAFQLVGEKSAEVYRRDMVWYGWFSDGRNGELTPRRQRYRSVVMHQTQGTDVGGGVRGVAATPSTLRNRDEGQSGDSPEYALTIDDEEGPERVPGATDGGSRPIPPRDKKRATPHADTEGASPVAKKTKTETDTNGMIQAEVDRMI